MNNREQNTTAISDNGFHPLEVEWNYYEHRYKIIDGVSVHSPVYQVSLVLPAGAFDRKRTRLVNMSPQTALNLLDWLE